MTGRNPWEILCVAEDTPYPEVQFAYRRRVKETHPDKGGDANEFAAVLEAREAIRRTIPPQRRQSPTRPTPYDRWLRPCRLTRSWTNDGYPASSASRNWGDSWVTPPTPSSGTDFAAILLDEVSKAQATAAHAA